MPALSRRAFLRSGTLCLAARPLQRVLAAEAEVKPLFQLGLMTDLHYADKEPTKTRFYREALAKLDEAVAYFNAHRPARVVELGDLIDQADDVEQEIAWLKVIEARFARLTMPRHYVLGNHCVTTLTKAEFAAHTGSAPTPHHHFDEAGVRFIVLDACYREDGAAYERKNFSWQDANIPPHELEWLRARLAEAPGPVVILAHQRLDEDKAHAVRNAAAVRAVLEQSGKVLAVFQGHSHQNDYQQIGGVHFCTLVAMVEGSGAENSGYALLEVLPDYSLRVHGFRRQAEREFRVRG